MNKALEKVTNLTVNEFRKVKENGNFVPCNVAINEAHASCDVHVYSFDLASGALKLNRFNLDFAKVDSVKFSGYFVRYWYALEYAKIMESYAKFTKALPETEEENARMDVIRARYENAEKALKEIMNSDAPLTVRLYALACRKEKEGVWPESIRAAFGNVEKELSALNVDRETLTAEEAKPLRAALTKFGEHIWIPTEDGTIAKFTYNANARLTVRVWQASYNGIQVDNKAKGSGKLKRVYRKSMENLGQIVLEYFLELQTKKEEEAERAAAKKSKPTEKKQDVQTSEPSAE